MSCWLMKTEPDVFSIENLEKSKQQTAPWEGVRNYQARNFMRSMKKGDTVLFYHSSCEKPGIYGLATVVKEAYPDSSSFDSKSEYFDPKSTPDNPRWFMVDVKFEKKLSNPLYLEKIKEIPFPVDFTLLRKGNRLSVFPVEGEIVHVLKQYL